MSIPNQFAPGVVAAQQARTDAALTQFRDESLRRLEALVAAHKRPQCLPSHELISQCAESPTIVCRKCGRMFAKPTGFIEGMVNLIMS